jgi:hypothetical protein
MRSLIAAVVAATCLAGYGAAAHALEPRPLDAAGKSKVSKKLRDMRRDMTMRRRVARAAYGMDRCGAQENDFYRCGPKVSRRLGFPIGTGDGQLSIFTPTPTSYEIQGRSLTGRVFRLTRVGIAGPYTATCAPVGGGCPASGVWRVRLPRA